MTLLERFASAESILGVLARDYSVWSLAHALVKHVGADAFLALDSVGRGLTEALEIDPSQQLAESAADLCRRGLAEAPLEAPEELTRERAAVERAQAPLPTPSGQQ